jgi:predicted nuclease of restriction endonuclease-like (RecB) superfamily
MDKGYVEFITDLKQRIVQSRYVAARLANREQLMLYLKTGWSLSEKIAKEKWGNSVIDRIAEDLQKQLPGLRGFSARNLRQMRRFYDEYQKVIIWQSVTAKIKKKTTRKHVRDERSLIPQLTEEAIGEQFWQISFTHHMLLLNKCKTNKERFFYIQQCGSQFWSVRILEHHIEAKLFKNRGKLPNNFAATLPPELTPSALDVFQDEYLMDFISQEETEDERVFETKAVGDIKNLVLRLGKGFCFIGNQYRLEVGGEEFFVDLLFFNRHLRSLVAFELKRGKFKPEYAGQLNFYLNVLDEKVRLAQENASIGIVLCKEKNNTVVEFAVRTIDKAMGVATYRTTREMPVEMKGILPDAGALARLL